jgi:uncharacterized protein (UPF0276 family)
LYRATLSHLGARPTLIEWDSELPTLSMLVEEAAIANRFMEHARDAVAA